MARKTLDAEQMSRKARVGKKYPTKVRNVDIKFSNPITKGHDGPSRMGTNRTH